MGVPDFNHIAVEKDFFPLIPIAVEDAFENIGVKDFHRLIQTVHHQPLFHGVIYTQGIFSHYGIAMLMLLPQEGQGWKTQKQKGRKELC